MNELATLAVAMGAGWASGIRLYGAIATLGLLEYFKLAALPGKLEVLGHPAVFGVALALFVCEFLADKIPYFDTTWDAVHTFIRIPAGAILASAAFAHYPSYVVVAAGLMGGSLALTSHASKSTTRAMINVSPEPVSNWTHSAVQDFGGIAIAFISVYFPILTIVLVLILALTSILVLRKGKQWITQRRTKRQAKPNIP